MKRRRTIDAEGSLAVLKPIPRDPDERERLAVLLPAAGPTRMRGIVLFEA
jgi:hypothetical protein